MDIDTFNRTIDISLVIALLEPAAANTTAPPYLVNRFAHASARIASLRVVARNHHDGCPLSPAQLDEPVLRASTIDIGNGIAETRLRLPAGHTAFRVRDILAAIEELEWITRPQSEWFGGIDVHHIFFEGLKPAFVGASDCFEYRWGS